MNVTLDELPEKININQQKDQVLFDAIEYFIKLDMDENDSLIIGNHKIKKDKETIKLLKNEKTLHKEKINNFHIGKNNGKCGKKCEKILKEHF